MRKQDRDAIRVIMKARAKKAALPVPPNGTEDDGAIPCEQQSQSLSLEYEPQSLRWQPFDSGMVDLLERALHDKDTGEFTPLVKISMKDENFDAQIDLSTMRMTNEVSGTVTQVHRQHSKPEAPPLVKCVFCQGAGHTSKWVTEDIIRQLPTLDTLEKIKKFQEKEVTQPDCCVCFCEPAKYGMSIQCEHLFCSGCIENSLKAMLESGQFPAYCVMCRAEDRNGKPKRGLVTRPALTFLEERKVIDKAFQFRFVSAIKRAEAVDDDKKESFPCPAKCGCTLYRHDPLYTMNDGKLRIGLSECPCGALVCLYCDSVEYGDSGLHQCDSSVSKLKAKELAMKATKNESDSLAAIGKLGKQCPACKLFIEKNEGCDWMMCGDTSHGSIVKAQRNGGCGLAFQWAKMTPEDDPCGWKDFDDTHRHTRPVTARMVRISGKEHPKCARDDCEYYASVDGVKIPMIHNVQSPQFKNNGGKYCCSDCKNGKAHGKYCHKCPHPDSIAKQSNGAAALSKGTPRVKYLRPFDAIAIRIMVYQRDIVRLANSVKKGNIIMKEKEKGAITQQSATFNFTVLTVDDSQVELHSGKASKNANLSLNYRPLRLLDSTIITDLDTNGDADAVNSHNSNLNSLNLKDEEMGELHTMELHFGRKERVLGIEGVYPTFPFTVYYVDEDACGNDANESDKVFASSKSDNSDSGRDRERDRDRDRDRYPSQSGKSLKWEWKKYSPMLRTEDTKIADVFGRALNLINQIPEDVIFGSFVGDVNAAVGTIWDEKYQEKVLVDMDYIKRNEKKRIFAFFKNRAAEPRVRRKLIQDLEGASASTNSSKAAAASSSSSSKDDVSNISNISINSIIEDVVDKTATDRRDRLAMAVEELKKSIDGQQQKQKGKGKGVNGKGNEKEKGKFNGKGKGKGDGDWDGGAEERADGNYGNPGAQTLREKQWIEAMDRAAIDIERKMIADMFPNMCQCPACGLVMEKISGDDSMMCGCEAKPAGGTMQKALAGGGCGHEFDFTTGVAKGGGAKNHPENERQFKFHTASYELFNEALAMIQP